jgi:hypothetical protein
MQRHRVPVALVSAATVALSIPLALPAQTLRGSSSAVERAYERASDRGLYFYKTTSGVRTAAEKGRFVRLAGNANYRTHRVSQPYATETTRTFVERLAAQYRSSCGEQLIVTSAIRPLSSQPANGSDLSVHPTGTAIDFRKPRGKCLTWLRRTLLALEVKGVIDATEEYSPPHFHVAVFGNSYQRYLVARGVKPAPATAPATVVAESNGATGVALAPVARTTSSTTSPSRASASTTTRRYTVRRGDSLWGIARRFGTTLSAIRRLNPDKSARILPGQTIVVPGA